MWAFVCLAGAVVDSFRPEGQLMYGASTLPSQPKTFVRRRLLSVEPVQHSKDCILEINANVLAWAECENGKSGKSGKMGAWEKCENAVSL